MAKEGKKGFIGEFKEFIMSGNVMVILLRLLLIS